MSERSSTSPATDSPPPPPGRPRVALLRTAPETVLDDYARLMRSAGYADGLDRDAPTALKVNVSWQHWYPACSTAPWQLDGSDPHAAG